MIKIARKLILIYVPKVFAGVNNKFNNNKSNPLENFYYLIVLIILLIKYCSVKTKNRINGDIDTLQWMPYICNDCITRKRAFFA